MVTDMQRLERAARLSMGDFETLAPAAPVQRRHRLSRPAIALLALAVLAAAAVLFG
jgi:hypothetical protein